MATQDMVQEPITNCRLCGSDRLSEVYSLGNMHISGFWEGDESKLLGPTTVTDDSAWIVQRDSWPLNLWICSDCGLLQLSHNAPQEILYARHYWYRSGTNEKMVTALHDIVESILFEQEHTGGLWLDIGANDGTLLSFVPTSWRRVGCEPATNLQDELKDHCEKLIEDFWSADAYFQYSNRKADVITAIGMFYDLEDPNAFVRDMKLALADGGVIVCQLMCLEQMLRLDDVGNVCHEHLEYYSYENLVQLFERNGLEIYRVEENDVNGGSFRIWARHYQHGSVEWDPDNSVTLQDIYGWIDRIEANRDEVVKFIEAAVYDGTKVWVYGASTKGCVILQYYGLTAEHIVAAADRNPDKHGRFIAGTGIPITSEEAMRRASPDYLLMLPYAFRDAFMERERDWWETGGQWIIPLPKLEIV